MPATSAIAALMRGPMIGAPTAATVDGLADPDEPGITAKQRANRRAYQKIAARRATTVKRCPFCHFDDVQIDETSPGRFAVVCPECECIGPVSEVSAQGAIMAWNLAFRGKVA